MLVFRMLMFFCRLRFSFNFSFGISLGLELSFLLETTEVFPLEMFLGAIHGCEDMLIVTQKGRCCRLVCFIVLCLCYVVLWCCTSTDDVYCVMLRCIELSKFM